MLTKYFVVLPIGNYKSVIRYINSFSELFICNASINNELILKADYFIIPGLGSFDSHIEFCENNSLVKTIKQRAFLELPIIGICAGMQILFNESKEGTKKGLGLIEGKISELESFNIGWISTFFLNKKLEILNNFYYYNHSYFISNTPYDFAISEIKSQQISSAVLHKNILGLQFHPEKSQNTGRLLLRNLNNIFKYD